MASLRRVTLRESVFETESQTDKERPRRCEERRPITPPTDTEWESEGERGRSERQMERGKGRRRQTEGERETQNRRLTCLPINSIQLQ